MLVALQFAEVTVAVVPLNLTVLAPCVAPKFAPAIVTDAPTTPLFGVRLVMLGAATTVNVFALLAVPDTVTMTLPLVAPDGTVVVMTVDVQLADATVAAIPLNLTVLVPGVAPKFVPVMVTDAPTAPVVIDRLVIVGTAAREAGGMNIRESVRKAVNFHLSWRINPPQFNLIRCYDRPCLGKALWRRICGRS